MAERIDPGRTNASPWAYTTRLQKGGALLDDMRQLVWSWSDAPVAAQRESGVRSNILNKGTRTRPSSQPSQLLRSGDGCHPPSLPR
jgi:hypothetical protein